MDLHLYSMILNRFSRLITEVIKLLPEPVILFIKNNIKIIKKLDYEHGQILLEITSKNEYQTRAHSCKKEPETVKWIETYFKENEVFFDIGANVGAYSLVACQHLARKIKVYAFEPGFMTYYKLCKNINLNNMHNEIIPLQLALSDKTKIEVFNYADLREGSSCHALGVPIDQYGKSFTPKLTQYLMSYRLDCLIDEFNIPTPNHMKIDVDGVEYEILKGSEKILSSPELKTILIELQEDTKEGQKIKSYIMEKGFIETSKHRHAQTTTCNSIFIREKRS